MFPECYSLFKLTRFLIAGFTACTTCILYEYNLNWFLTLLSTSPTHTRNCETNLNEIVFIIYVSCLCEHLSCFANNVIGSQRCPIQAQITHNCSPSQNALIWKSPGFVPFGGNMTHFGAKPTIPATTHRSMLDRGARWATNRTNCIPLFNIRSCH